MDSATIGFRPLTFSFCFEPFVSSSERNVFPPLSEILRFFERLQCFFKRFIFRSFRFLDPLVFISFQGAAAAAAGRGSPPPPGRRGELLGRDSISALFSREIQYKRDRRGRGRQRPSSPAPRPRARFCETCRRKWRVRVRVRRCAQHGGFRPLLTLPLVLRVLLN